MSTTVIPYLFFSGRCEAALAFYARAAGAKMIMSMKFSDSPDPVPAGMLAPGFEHKIMHASFTIGDTTIFASDGCDDKSKFESFSLAISVSDEADCTRIFNGLAEGGEVTMPLGPTFWSPRYGMLKDQFGIHWMVMVAGESPPAT
jgi:PhnB protein